MLKLSLRNLWAMRSRAALTAGAVVLGVSFVVAAFVLSDGLRSTFGTLSKEIYQGTDLVVRDEGEFGESAMIDEDLVARINNIDGVRAGVGSLGNDGPQPVKSNGDVVSTIGPPIIAISWTPDPDLNAFEIVDGMAPGPDQFVMDIDSAERHGFEIGETYDVTSSTGTYMFEMVGHTRFGADNGTNGAVLMGFDVVDTRVLLDYDEGTFDQIDISIEEGYSASDVQSSVAAITGPGLEVINNQTLVDEQASDFNEGISILQNVLLGFAGVALFVSIFIVYNIFGITVAQRMREIGLLRAIGADIGQIRRSIVIESLIIGLVASALGILGGIGLNSGLRALFSALGAEMPASDLVLSPRTIIAAFSVGVLVTIVSALIPAMRAGSISPVAAMGGEGGADEASGARRLVTGAMLCLLGLIVGALGLNGVGSTAVTIAALAVGAIAIFVGVALASPAVVAPVLATLGWPISAGLGASGRLARRNSVRHPARTATTAAALMVGLALVTTALVVGTSIKAQIATTLETSNRADYVIATDSFDNYPVEIAQEVDALPETGTTVAVSGAAVQFDDGEVVWYSVGDLASFAALLDVGVDSGTMAEVDGLSLALPVEEATELGMVVGDEIDFSFENGEPGTATLVATFTDQSIVDGGFLDDTAVEAIIGEQPFEWMAAQVADGVSATDADAALDALGANWPQLNIQTSAEYRESIEGEIDQMLTTINALLALALLIALIGIGLTLALAIVERTRELGLLRAVGMTRRQMRRMVRWEAALIAMFGAVVGVAVGLLFGWASVQAMPDTFITTVSIPVVRLLILVAVAGAAGLGAAMLPARRAGRLNVLDAISHS